MKNIDAPSPKTNVTEKHFRYTLVLIRTNTRLSWSDNPEQIKDAALANIRHIDSLVVVEHDRDTGAPIRRQTASRFNHEHPFKFA